ncbi:MAG: hypothetical protein P1V35_12075 [Planctomycetota bacterium]|nr:hypothetical protein [Planctomycetota bacterium]
MKSSIFCMALSLALFLSPFTEAHPKSTQPASIEFDFQAQADRAMMRHGVMGTMPEEFSFDDYCKLGFVHLEIGLYDLYMEQDSFAEATDAKRMFGVAQSLVALQQRWLDWIDPAGSQYKNERDVCKKLHSYLGKAKLGEALAAAKVVATPGGDGMMEGPSALDLWTVLDVDPAQLETFRALNVFLQTNGGMGLDREAKSEKMVLYPGRERFVEVTSLAGWARPEARGSMWNTGIFTWTNFYVNDWRFLSFQFSAANPNENTYRQGSNMEDRSPTGLKQQICQLAALGLLDNYFGGKVPPSVAGGLSINLVVDVFKECNTRVDGDLRERRKEARSMFVPGGQSEGGVLPPNLADSRWRDTHGKDRFIGVLKSAQSAGKEAQPRRERKDKVRYFELLSDDESERAVTMAPVLGAEGRNRKVVPLDYYGDRLEFARCYSTCFLYWMREKGGGKKAKDSHQKFAAWLTAMGTTAELDAGGILAADPINVFEKIFQEQYGRPLSDADLDPKKSLEGAFLHWLPKGR